MTKDIVFIKKQDLKNVNMKVINEELGCLNEQLRLFMKAVSKILKPDGAYNATEALVETLSYKCTKGIEFVSDGENSYIILK